MTAQTNCPDCTDDEPCQSCCDHEFDPSEGYTCLNCGLDGLESSMSRAYDMAKDRWKYGD